ncbi:hypothetical protein [Mesoplasma melaleucae]|uniref:hypothetical protein n=1 Tax=Mesoplasma melaleucae TaxID=81459 RepID=UPI000A5DABB9|nr:hypothetical protein [Mesoplasma melaleucae]
MASLIIAKWVKQNNLKIDVTNITVKDLNDNYGVVITMTNFKEFAQKKLLMHTFIK